MRRGFRTLTAHGCLFVQIKLWGTRGSLPRAMTAQSLATVLEELVAQAKAQGITTLDGFATAAKTGGFGKQPLYFGGNTSCYEVSQDNVHAFVDMGTGITDACYTAMTQGRKEFVIFQTHVHWDHIMGLPFFVPIYIPGNKLTIYHVHKNAPDHIRLLFNGVNFPVKWSDLGATIEFCELKPYQQTQLGAMSVTPFALDHPGGSFGYRFESAGKSIAVGVDGEYKRLTAKELGKDLPFYQNLDLLIFDGQYDMDELASRYDWGHSSPPIGIDLALREGIRNIVLTHHDPRTGESKSRRMLDDARKHCQTHLPAYQKTWDSLGQSKGPNIYAGYDGLILDLEKMPPT